MKNRFFRWIGVMPYDDFDYYADDVMNVLEAFERFTMVTRSFNEMVANKLGIVGKDGDFKEKDDYDGDMYG